MSRLLKKRSGSIAIEALASLMLLFIAVYSMWGLSVFIYNQSRVSTATQLAAQAGIIMINQTNFSSSDSRGLKKSVSNVFTSNICGMLPGQQTNGGPPGDSSCKLGILSSQKDSPSPEYAYFNNYYPGSMAYCASDISNFSSPGGSVSVNNCNNLSTSKAVRVSVEGRVRAPFSLINSLGGSEENNPVISDVATVYSYRIK